MLKVAGGGGTTGAVNYKGTWNASANSPTLTSSVGTQGDYYVVNIAGSTNLNGITDWQIGDWAIFNGSVWQKVDNTDGVTSVNGQTGVVVLGAANVGATPNTTFVLTSGLLSGGGQLTGNVTVNLTSVPVANVTGAVPNTVNVLAGTGLAGGGNLSSNVTLDLANTAVTAGTYGSSTQVSQITVDAQGRITSAANVSISGGGSGTVTNVATGTGLTGGPITTTGTISIANTTVTPASYGSSNTVATFTVNAQGQLTAAANATIAISNAQVSGLGTMATQNANAVTITGGDVTANVTSANVNLTGTTSANATFATSSLPLVPEGYLTVQIGGVNKKIPYYGV